MACIPSPKQIEVGGFTYAIRLVPGLARLDGIRGRCDFNRMEILIDNDDLPAVKTATLLHEVLHAIDNVWLQHSLSDSQVDALAGGLHQVLQAIGVEIIWPPEQGG